MKVSHLKDELLKSSLSEEQKYDVLCGNATRLFRLDDPEKAFGQPERRELP
jgi:hypothetical protein